jgi:hypothetical protein
MGPGTDCVPNECPVVTGACCSPSAGCTEVTEAQCIAQGFSYKGDGVLCTTYPCPQGCCFQDGTCLYIGALECIDQGGTNYGPDCDPSPCPGTSGACCFFDGHCELATPGYCGSRGVYYGHGTVCPPEPCDVETLVGACCGLLGGCGRKGEWQCSYENGTFLGLGTMCTEDGCIPRGACCAPDETCTLTTQAECTNGEWQGLRTVCDPNPCTPMGACCAPDGSCSVTAEPDCAGVYQGADTACDPNPCPQPGACCDGDGVCTFVAEPNCEGAFQGAGTTCDPNPCPQPGACCDGNGACTFVVEAACKGTFQGPGTTCDPNPCPQPGACCLLGGDCVITTSTLCSPDQGIFMGAGSVCDPTPCPLDISACCFGFGFCALSTAEECAAHEGVFLGGGVACYPENPCQQTGACCAEDGSCTATFPQTCLGDFQGVGTPCDPNPCPPVGACCLDAGICLIGSEAECQGAWQGEGTTCAPVNPCSGSPEGTFSVTLKPVDDPHGHDAVVHWSEIGQITFTLVGDHLSTSGADPYVPSDGTLNPDRTFILEGQGTVGGYQDVDIHIEGQFTDERASMSVSGTIKLGTDSKPFQLPNGSITYSLEGTRR